MAKVKMDSDWDGKREKKLDLGLLQMATDIHRRAIVLAPIDTRALVNSGIIEKVTGGYRIKFGNSRVPYARRRHYENKKNPQTKMYLSKATDSVTRGNTKKYFKDI